MARRPVFSYSSSLALFVRVFVVFVFMHLALSGGGDSDLAASNYPSGTSSGCAVMCRTCTDFHPLSFLLLLPTSRLHFNDIKETGERQADKTSSEKTTEYIVVKRDETTGDSYGDSYGDSCETARMFVDGCQGERRGSAGGFAVKDDASDPGGREGRHTLSNGLLSALPNPDRHLMSLDDDTGVELGRTGWHAAPRQACL
ncbi:hypothetical protein MGYG_08172 [Nannizzia gypsea CBS 118893]|uniref:Uncharacterized protein n=1 Tax=Arthroderma gypseum (strain ATCC MYA-4604 / CBS 118893) TaxID=535722 RepID=E4V585_ARTGP|nr:hypothetical protein MGYG_08172 [Nannizzia gypsea CBS 118893]EFR05159.1 hypothetical protein MGYG_08172 [Nannizzia gypsea CBS 118893]